jgi:hypothetical protein
MEDNLMKLILAFEHETADMLLEFLQRAGLNSPFEWREAGLVRQGYIGGRPRIVYRFHGAGLKLRIGPRRIDFDFGYDGRTGGFDEWWLWLFAKDRSEQFPEFQDHELIKAALKKARETGEIGKPFSDRQDKLEYRLASVTPCTTLHAT